MKIFVLLNLYNRQRFKDTENSVTGNFFTCADLNYI